MYTRRCTLCRSTLSTIFCVPRTVPRSWSSRAALHGRAHVVNNFRALYGSVHGGGISQITEDNFDVGIAHELRRRLPANEDANAIPFVQQASHQMSPD